MSTLCAGLSIGRKELVLVLLHGTGQNRTVVFQHRLPRTKNNLIEELTQLLKSIPKERPINSLSIAISPSELACADCFNVPYRTEKQLEAVKSSLAESRACGETAEELCVDLFQLSTSKVGSLIELAAIRRDLLQSIREAIKNTVAIPLVLVTTIPSALAHGLKLSDDTHTLAFLGETLELSMDHGLPTQWQMYPTKTNSGEKSIPEPSGHLPEKFLCQSGLGVDLAIASAVTVACVDSKQIVNFLRDVDDAPKSLSAKLRRPLLQAMSAVALLCFAAGLYFQQRANALTDGLEHCELLERTIEKNYLPLRDTRDKKSATLSIKDRVTKTLADSTRNKELNTTPSVLSFWNEIGSHLPSADKMGLTLESLQLSSDTGRMIARVETTPTDPLGNASLLERSLNSPDGLMARGEFESKNNEIIVRLRLDYQPNGMVSGAAKKERVAP